MRSKKSVPVGKLKFEYNIAFTYLLLGFLWIVFSDKALDLLVRDDALLTKFQTWKGSFYVIVTALILYFMVRRHIQKLDRAEFQRIEGENRYKALFQENLSVMLIIDPEDGSIVDANQAACNYHGWNHAELCSMKVFEINPLPAEKILEIMKDARLKNQNYLLFQHKLASGELREVEVFSGPITFGGSVLLYAIIHDITDKVKSAEQIRLLSLAMQQSTSMVLICNSEAKIEYVNPAFCNMTGYSQAEVIGQTTQLFYSGEHPAEFYEQIRATILGGRHWSGEFKDRKKNGEIYWVNAGIYPLLNEAGEITHLVLITEDITTKRKMVEELIEAKEKAEASNKLKTAFMNNISHEIRTPLNAIQGFAPLIIDPMLDLAEKQELIKILNASSQRLIQTITDYVDISLITSSTIEVFKYDFQLEGLLREVREQFQARCDEKKINLIFDVSENLRSSVIHSDQGMLLKILGHLLDNAIKFTSKGAVTLGVSNTNDICTFFVSDTGTGISKEAYSMIFKSFVQEDSSNTRAYEGSGLGLSIVNGLVTLLGGSVVVASEKGIGSTFSFTVAGKIRLSKPISISSPAANAEKNTRPLILIAEDEDSNYRLMEIILKSSYKVLRAENGLEAVNLCRSTPGIQLVLMDIKMPVMNGYEATRQIRQFDRDICIIAQTAYGLIGDREKAVEAGCNDYIIKPIAKDKLLTLLQERCLTQ